MSNLKTFTLKLCVFYITFTLENIYFSNKSIKNPYIFLCRVCLQKRKGQKFCREEQFFSVVLQPHTRECAPQRKSGIYYVVFRKACFLFQEDRL